MTREARGATAKDALRLRPESASLYLGARDAMLDEVNARMAAHPQIHTLVGGNPLGMMYDNHRHHVDFLATVLQFNSFAMLDKILPWVYRTYRAHGFSFDYFPLALAAWKQAVKNHVGSPEAAADIVALYDWMLTNHPLFVERSALVSDDEPPYPELAKSAEVSAPAPGGRLRRLHDNAKRSGPGQGQTLLYLGLIQPSCTRSASLGTGQDPHCRGTPGHRPGRAGPGRPLRPTPPG
jgi:hypothetical protein